MPDPPRKYPHDVQNVHPDYSPPKEKPMPASLDDILRAQQDTIAELRKKEKREEVAATVAVTKADLQHLGTTVVKEIKALREDVEERFNEVDERFDQVDEEFKGVKARVTLVETALETTPPHRARIPTSMPPRSPAELGLKATDTGSRWVVDDAGEWVRKWTEQEAMRKGAEEALEEVRVEADRQKASAEKEAERKQAAFDRKLKNWGIGLGIASLVFSGAIATITYMLTHVSIHSEPTDHSAIHTP